MEASNENNAGSTKTPGATIVTPASPGGQGDFSLKPAGRKKGVNRLIILIVTGFLLAGILLVSLLAFLVLRHPDGETPVDESQVKPSPLLQGGKTSDNSMTERMGFLNAQSAAQKTTPAPVTGTASVAAPPAEQPPQANNTGSAPVDTGSTTAETQAQPVQRHEESMFTPISRFDSSGMSGGVGGGGNAGSSGGEGSDDREAKLRAFVNADPAELARNLVSGAGGASGSGGLTGSGGGSLLDNLNGTEYAATKARLAPPGKFRLKKYTAFQCSLITGIKTNYPGFTKCTLTMPLYSADGSVILARAGAELRGEQKVEVHAGQTSVFTSWTELETSVAGSTQSVLTPLNGLGTDAMGRSGTDAEIDNHWGQRIGGAMLLSLFQDTTSNLAKRAGGSNGNNNYSNTENTTEDMASKVLDANINIAPTGYVKPGTVINVIVAQDIDFSSVYTTRG